MGPTPSVSAARPGLVVRLALIVGPLVVLLGVAELLLWALGLGDGGGGLHASRGFDPRGRYLVPQEDGSWRTQMYGDEPGEQVLPARTTRKRVLLVGGSNTQGFPHGALDSLLEGEPESFAHHADANVPAGGWEVMNLGRQGYGSARVAILLDQAMALEPDVVVIYSGHNEFIEEGFARELEQVWGDGTLAAGTRTVSHWLEALRTYRTLSGLFGDLAGDPALNAPDPIGRQARQLWTLSWEETLGYYELYERNLERMCRAALEGGAEVVLCTLVSNMLWAPMMGPEGDDLPEDVRRRTDTLMDEALILVPEFYRPLARPGAERIGLKSWGKLGLREGVEEVFAAPPLRPMLGALAEAPRTWGRASMKGYHWPHPAGWDPAVRQHLQRVQFWLERKNGHGPNDLRRAVARYDKVLELVPRHPQALFERALCAYLLGAELEDIVDDLDLAAAHDRAPRSANAQINAIVREVAARNPGVTLVDAEDLFRERCPDGLVGFEVMMDACHLQPGARFVLMADLAPVIRGLVPGQDGAGPGAGAGSSGTGHSPADAVPGLPVDVEGR